MSEKTKSKITKDENTKGSKTNETRIKWEEKDQITPSLNLMTKFWNVEKISFKNYGI